MLVNVLWDGVISDNTEGTKLFIKEQVKIVLCTKPTVSDMYFTIYC